MGPNEPHFVDNALSSESSESSSNYSESTSSDSDEPNWIQWFCGLTGNEFFAEVEDEWIMDRFNLTGLNEIVPHCKEALDVILDVEITNEEETENGETYAPLLYGLIHARYILTHKGMQQMWCKFNAAQFGVCPRVSCNNQNVLPTALTDIPREHVVKLFCPRCREIYNSRSLRHRHLDGAFWGTTFCHLLLMTYLNEFDVKTSPSYTPRIFGFKINEASGLYPEINASNNESQDINNSHENKNNSNSNNNKGNLDNTNNGKNVNTMRKECSKVNNNKNNNSNMVKNCNGGGKVSITKA